MRKENGGTEGPVITRMELTPAFVPFRDVVLEAMQSGEGGVGMAIPSEEPWLGGDFVILRLVAEDCSVGLGEAFLWLPESGATPEQVIEIIRRALHRYVLGESPFDVEHIGKRMDNNVTRNEAAKGIIDMACHDLMGRIRGRPVCDLIGGRKTDRIPLTALIPLINAGGMVWLVNIMRDTGYNSFRLKIGRSVDDDVEIVRSVRDSLGEEAHLRVDYNQAYDESGAVRAIKAIEPFGVDVAEQPVGAFDYAAMARVQRHVQTPLMAHEGCFSLWDIMTLAELGSIGVVGINADRPGGITKALRAVEFARERGMGVVIHNQTLGIASAAQIHLAAATYNRLGHDPELFGYVMFEEDLITDPIDYEGATAGVPQGPGLGVELDMDALDRHATGPTVVVEA